MGRYRIDLRSDIHGAPTVAMLRAMSLAEVGGDALAGEDPAVRELEETAAAMFRKEAALFVCSGTMGNIVSLLAISRPGGAVIADPHTHIVSSEAGGFERLGGCTLIPVETDGILTGDKLRECVRSRRLPSGDGAVVCVENSHALRGGIPWGTDVAAGLVEAAREHRLKLHVDGARIFNASAATGAAVADLVAGADTVQVCLAKGLGAPMGSLVVGSRDVIDCARRYRQMLGGGVHKAGIMAAAGLIALRDMPERIPEDHRRAKRLAERLLEVEELTPAHPVLTNIVDLVFDPKVVDGEGLVAVSARQGLGVTGPWNGTWGRWIRLVAHHDIGDRDIEEAADIIVRAVRESRYPVPVTKGR